MPSLTINDPRETPYESLHILGVAIKDDNGQRHVGLLYKHSEQPVKIIHLGWHYMLDDAPPAEEYYWLQCELDDISKRLIAARLSMVLERNRPPGRRLGAIPYGIEFSGDYFDQRTMQYGRLKPGEGLTCATFVLAIFKDLGFQLLREEEWPHDREGDRAWQEYIVQKLRETPWVAQAHTVALQEHIGRAARYRPEEVAGAVAKYEVGNPIGFDQAQQLGREILAIICSPS